MKEFGDEQYWGAFLMARIRSIHPGLFTDEAFMALSSDARVLLLGLWCEADDQGVFEWKPLTIKARILPVNDVDARVLLEELSAQNIICQFEAGGKVFGAVRNFRKFQRPQKPTAQFPLPEGIAKYVGLSTTTTEPITEKYDSPTGKSPQMEDVGCRREEEGGKREEKGKVKERAGARAAADAAPTTKPTPRSELLAVIDEERASAVIEHRQRIRKPLTAHAAKLLSGKFALCPDPNEAADAMVAAGWQGFEPEWLEGRTIGRGPGPPRTRNGGGDPMMNVIKDAYNEPDEQAEALSTGSDVRNLPPPGTRGH